MKTLPDLPEDLLYLVALTFEWDRPTLFAFAKSCRAVYRATRSLLFRHLSHLSINQLERFERIAAEDPTLRRLVHSYPVYVKFGEVLNDGLRTSLGYINLRELTLISSHDLRPPPKGLSPMARVAHLMRSGRGEDEDFECTFLDVQDLSRLRHISLVGNFTATEILRFMLLPFLKRLDVRSIALLRPPYLPPDFTALRSNLTSLSITGDELWSVRPEVLGTIFSACTVLRDLRCQIPAVTGRTGRHVGRTSAVQEAVSPAALEDMLASLQNTLRKLSLLQLRHNVPYDGTHMNLSNFKQLIDLEITSCCLLPPGAPSKERNGMYELLPSGLTRLELIFPRESGVFFHHLEGDSFLTQNPSAIPEARYSWIADFLRHKVTYLPDLAYVAMYDPPGATGYKYWKRTRWIVPTEISKMARDAGVELKVNISVSSPRPEVKPWAEREYSPKISVFPWDANYSSI